MADAPSLKTTAPPPAPLPGLSRLQRRLHRLRLIVPLILLALVVVYEIGPSRWIQNTLGDAPHYIAEIIVFGTLGPLLAFVVLELLDRWLAERDTSDLQSQALSQAREQARHSQQLNEDAVQALFAANLVLSSLEQHLPELPPASARNVQAVRPALEQALRRLGARLQAQQ